LSASSSVFNDVWSDANWTKSSSVLVNDSRHLITAWPPLLNPTIGSLPAVVAGVPKF